MRLESERAKEAWSLPEAVSALGHAARQAGRPSWLLLFGLVYPPILLFLDMQIVPSAVESVMTGDWKSGSLFGSDSDESILGLILAFIFIFVPLMRFVPGIAAITSPSAWNQFAARGRPPGVRDAWRAGKGLWLSSLGLYIQTFLMIGLGFLICLGPALLGTSLLGFDQDVVPVVLLPVLAFLLLYSLVLSMMYQLALHSLAQNRRGVGSAMLHAWRLMQHHPAAVGRTLLVDTVLSVTVWGILAVVVLVLGLTCVLLPLALPIALTLFGFIGVTRAGFWSRAYRSLGGVTQQDGLPGIPRPSA